MKDINESSMSRIYQKLVDDSSCALISTYRSERSENENHKLLQELKQDVRAKFGFIEFIARWAEKLDNNEVVASDERSLLIPNISLTESMQLAKKYNLIVDYNMLKKDYHKTFNNILKQARYIIKNKNMFKGIFILNQT